MPSAIPVSRAEPVGTRPSTVDEWELRFTKYVYSVTGQLAAFESDGRIVARDGSGTTRADRVGETRWVRARQVLRGVHAGKWVIPLPPSRRISTRTGRQQADINLAALVGTSLDYGLGPAIVPVPIDVDRREYFLSDPITGEVLGAGR